MTSKKLPYQLHLLLTLLELKNFSCCNMVFFFHMLELPGFTLGPQSLCGHTQSSYKGTLSKDTIAPVYMVEQVWEDPSKLCHKIPSATGKDEQLRKPKSKQKSSILPLLQMVWDLSCQDILFWVRMNRHCFCLVSWELCLYNGSLETVGQLCQDKINLKTLEEIIALLYLCKCVPGRTKTGVVSWRCRNVKTKHSVTSPAQEIRSTELCPWLIQSIHWHVPRVSVPMFKIKCIISVLLVFLEVLRCHFRGIYSENPSPFLFPASFAPNTSLPNGGCQIWMYHSVTDLGKLASIWF